MKRFPSKHGVRVVFDPLRSQTPLPSSRPIPKSGPVPRGLTKQSEEPPAKPRTPSFAEIDEVSADLAKDPRFDPDTDA
ncbi:MAG: hypothetical protein ACLQVI_35565 [Polyangiaceae bacterium]|jgi:hypothetical protein